MAWIQITFVIDAEQRDNLSSMLELFLAQAITEENAGEDEFYEVAFPGTPDWKKVAITALFDAKVEPQPIIEFITEHLNSNASAPNEIPVTIEKLQDQDWERVWLSSFKPTKVGDQLWVCPSWCEPTEPNERNIILDPGLAFGTGTHPTTAMCLQWLSEQNLNGQTVLDYGCGSGILAIAALLANAEHADATDIDPLAVTATLENAERNHVASKLEAFLPDQLDKSARYPVLIANILAEVIIELHDILLLHLAPGGKLILTGILNTQAQKVMDAFSPEISFTQRADQHWCLLIGTRLDDQ